MNDFIELRQFMTAALRRWWLITFSVVLAGVLGYAVSRTQTPVYEAATTLIVGKSIETTNLDRREIETSQLLAQTYADIAKRQPILQGTIDTLNLSVNWRALGSRVQVKPIAGTQLIEIAVEANSPDEAQQIADEIARQLILLSPTSRIEEDANQRFVRQRLETLQANILEGQNRIEALETGLADVSSLEEIRNIQNEVDLVENLMASWDNTYASLLNFSTVEEFPNNLAVIEPAQVNPSPVRPRTSVNVAVAGVVGLFLALGVVVLLEHLDDTFKSADDFSRGLGLNLLGAIGCIEGKSDLDRLIPSHQPFSHTPEEYRILRSNIQILSVDQPAKFIMVTSPVNGAGKTMTAANLGVVMAQAGLKTIVVDANLRRPALHRIFHLPDGGGLSELLCVPEFNIDGQLRATDIENLHVITGGNLPPDPAELLGSPRMGQLLSFLGEQSDVVIIDSPPTLGTADAVMLSRQVDGVLLVIDASHTRRDAARQAVLVLARAGANVLGGVLNRVPKREAGYSYL